MVKNNIELDVKVKCIENGTTQAQIAEDIQTTKSYESYHQKAGRCGQQYFHKNDGGSWVRY